MKVDRLVRSRWAAIGAAVAVSLGAGGVLAANALPPGTPASFEPLSPVRILSTRDGISVTKAKIGPGQEITLQVTGAGGIPSDATSAVHREPKDQGTEREHAGTEMTALREERDLIRTRVGEILAELDTLKL